MLLKCKPKKTVRNLSDKKSRIFSYTMDYDDCTVMTEMPLGDEVADFIEKGLHRDMTDKDVIDGVTTFGEMLNI